MAREQADSGLPIRVLARVSFLSVEEGGLNGSRRGTYRPNHNFGAPRATNFHIGQVEIPEGTELQAGETYELTVTFLNAEGIADLATKGRKWRIQEGPKLIAIAEVL